MTTASAMPPTGQTWTCLPATRTLLGLLSGMTTVGPVAFLNSQHKAVWVLTKVDVADNTYRDGSSGLRNNEESFIKHGGVSVDQRKMNAVRAFFEWLPIR